MMPAPFDPNELPDPDFPPRPGPGGNPGLGPLGPSGRAGAAELPGRPGLGLAAAPVPVDYAPPQAPDFTVPSRAAGLVLSAESGPAGPVGPPAPYDRASTPPGAADPSYIWDLAATDVFPAAAVPAPPTEAPGPVPEDGEPGASGR
jgi:hypothetical protein